MTGGCLNLSVHVFLLWNGQLVVKQAQAAEDCLGCLNFIYEQIEKNISFSS